MQACLEGDVDRPSAIQVPRRFSFGFKEVADHLLSAFCR